MSEQLPPDSPRVGVDEWVATHEERVARPPGLAGVVQTVNERVPWWGWLALAAAAGAATPAVFGSDYIVRVAVNTTLFALLAIGLNVVVGYAGLLDLGYVAFFGFGAYLYAFLSSAHFGLHWPTEVVMLLVLVASAILGLLLGLPSRRLLGDYLAIVTLFFAQIFLVLTTNGNRIALPWEDGASDITGGPNGITGVDQMSIFSIEINSIDRLMWLSVAAFVVVVAALHFVNESRTGRAWRALREDPLAAEAMTIPVNRLKLLAFMFGAAIAGLTGTVFAAVQANVFPQNFDLPLLIMVYAMVILGGAGSLGGVVIGAAIITIATEVLENPEWSPLVFYAAVVVVLVAFVRPWWKIAALFGSVAVTGVIVRVLADAAWERGTAGEAVGDSVLSDLIGSWVLLPAEPRIIANVALVLLIGGILALTVLRGMPRLALGVPVLYLAVFVWENRLIHEPSVTRLLLLGTLLVALMTARPQGLLGTSRVEIV